jgi:hypothetical protein
MFFRWSSLKILPFDRELNSVFSPTILESAQASERISAGYTSWILSEKTSIWEQNPIFSWRSPLKILLFDREFNCLPSPSVGASISKIYWNPLLTFLTLKTLSLWIIRYVLHTLWSSIRSFPLQKILFSNVPFELFLGA